MELQSNYECERVKEKKKQLLLKIQEMRAEIGKKQSIVNGLEDDLKRLKGEMQAAGQEEPAQSRFNLFMRDICIVTEAIVSEGAFMQAKYTTQSSQMYYRVEKEIFEGYIERLSELSVKEFLEFCKKLSFVKLENGKCVFPSGRKRVYFLNKGIVDGLSL